MSQTQPEQSLQTQPNANAGLMEQRGHAMLLDYNMGVSFSIIASRYGCLPSEVEALVMKAQEDAIIRNDHIHFRTEAMNELTILARELAEMDKQTDLVEEVIEEILGSDNKPHPLKKQISHHQTKIRIKIERRSNAIARVAISGAKTGEGDDVPRANPNSDARKIGEALQGVASDIMREFFVPVVDNLAQANQEVGRLQAANTHTIDISAERAENEEIAIAAINQSEETCESREGIIMTCQSCGRNEGVLDLRNPANAQYLTLSSPGELEVCRPCLEQRKASLGGGLTQSADSNLAEMR